MATFLKHRITRRGLVLCAALIGSLMPALSLANTIRVTTTSDTVDGTDNACSLREAVSAANDDTASGDTATYASECRAGSSTETDSIILAAGSTYTLSGASADDSNASGDLDVVDDVTILVTSGSNAIIDGDEVDRVLHVQSGFTLTLNKITIQNGSVDGNGGGIYADSTATLTMIDSIVQNNTSLAANAYGGGIYMQIGTSTTLLRSIVRNNTCDSNSGGAYGAGMYVSYNSSVSLTDSSISRNEAISDSNNAYGGGIYFNESTSASANASLTINRSTISDNSTSAVGASDNGSGAGIYAYDSDATYSLTIDVLNSTISGNTGTASDGSVYGGGLYLWGTGVLNISHSTVAANTATGSSDAYGGGLYIDSSATANIKSSIIADNTVSGAAIATVYSPRTPTT